MVCPITALPRRDFRHRSATSLARDLYSGTLGKYIPPGRYRARRRKSIGVPQVGESGAGLGAKSTVEEADPPLSGPSPTLLPPLPRKPAHVSLMFLTRVPSTTSLSVHHLTPSTPCYSGPVRAPAFRERQTGAPRPGCKSSPWPPSVSRSTDRVTQDNGIDPKPFWRLRAIPEEPRRIKPRPGRPSRVAPGCGNYLSAHRTTVSGEKWELPRTATKTSPGRHPEDSI